MEFVNSGFTTVKKQCDHCFQKKKKTSVISNSVPDNNIAIYCYSCQCVTWTLESPSVQHHNTRDIDAYGFWSGL